MTAADGLRAFLAARDAAEPAVDPTMRSMLLEGDGDQAVLLLHGLTASPPAWSSIAAELHARGATVVALRLPLHGHAERLTTALEDMTVSGLTADIAEVVAAMAPLGKRLVLGGHSLGGTLALHAAATLPAVDRVVAVAPFLGIASLPHELHAALIAALRRLPNVFLWWDPVERERHGPAHGYPRYPLRSLGVGLAIADAVYADATHAPCARAIDLVINAGESSINNRTVRRLATRWRAASSAVAVHQLDGLPPSHDIIEPARPHSARARETLVRLLLARAPSADAVYPI